jgi:transglutaminase-like putative cysteine protease
VVRGQIERFPAEVFLRDTPLTLADPAIRDFAGGIGARGSSGLNLLHDLAAAVKEKMTFDTGPTDARTTAAEAFSHGHGVCQDFAHIFIAAARYLGIPARYVSGYLYRPDLVEQEAGHGWAEALVDDLGWVGFDPTNGVSASDAYARIAIGLDYLNAAPIRGTRYGGDGETLEVRVRVEGRPV